MALANKNLASIRDINYMPPLRVGSSGADVTTLQERLKQLGFDPGEADGRFGPSTEAAVMAFQRSAGLLADGIVGPSTAAALNLQSGVQPPSVVPDVVTAAVVSEMFPATPLVNIKANLPYVLGALVESALGDKVMALAALATIRAETESFQPISEFRSQFNTSPGGRPFDLYDNLHDLGNQGPPDGERYKGRGFIQLTGRANYQQFGNVIGLGNQLIDEPDLANDPDVAAKLLAAFLKSKEDRIRQALQTGDFATARRLVNGGSHGLQQFTAAYQIGTNLIPDDLLLRLA